MKLHPLFELFRKEAWIHECKALRWALGNDESTIYAELISTYNYFAEKDYLTDEGYFFLTIEDLYLKTHIEKRAQRSAINHLKKTGLIDMTLKGVPPVRFFKVENNQELLIKWVREGYNLMENARKAFDINKKDKTHLFKGAKCTTNKYIYRHWINVVNPRDELRIIQTDIMP